MGDEFLQIEENGRKSGVITPFPQTMQNSVKIAAIALFAILPASALAAPSISVTRTPASGNV